MFGMRRLFLFNRDNENIFSKTDKLGIMEFLCPVFPDQSRMALVLSSERLFLVFQFIQSHAHDGRL